MDAPNEQHTISSDEIALYDRQIRLWGLRAQEKIRTAKILIITLRGLGAEIAKNLALAGVGEITINDSGLVAEDDLAANFLVREEHVKQNRAEAAAPQIKEMNPRVMIHTDTGDIKDKEPEYFAAFDIVIATGLNFETMSKVNAACRVAQRPSYCADVHGLYGFIFSDLIIHDFVIEREKSNAKQQAIETKTRRVLDVTTKKEGSGKIMEVVTKREEYTPLLLANTSPLPEEFTRIARKRKQVTPLLTCLRALWEFERAHEGARPDFDVLWSMREFTQLAHERHSELRLDPEVLTAEFIRSFIQNLGAVISPVSAYIGGQLAADVINVLSAREQPLQNFLLFDGDKCDAPIYSLHPFFPEGAGAVPLPQ